MACTKQRDRSVYQRFASRHAHPESLHFTHRTS
jgi:hypothetical protein